MTTTLINDSRAEALLAYLHKGLVSVANERTALTLGDRGSYIGASDIAKAKGCFRQAVMDKLVPSHSHSLSELLTFERGHWQEDGIKAALDANSAKVIHQLEIEFSTGRTLCKFHLDLVLVTQKKTIVWESKSFRDTPPDKPYDSHNLQIRTQVKALETYWYEPAFRIAGSITDLVTFEELVNSQFGVQQSLEKNVEGWLICIGADEPKPFGPYEPESDDFWQCTLFFADKIAKAIASQQTSNLRYAKGVYPLCQYCASCNSCPKFRGQEAEEYADGVREFLELKQRMKALEAKEKNLKAILKHAFTMLQPDLPEDERFILTSAGRFSVSQEKRTDLKREKLIEALAAHGISPEAIQEIVAESTSTSEYEKLQTIQPKKAKDMQPSQSLGNSA